MSDSQHIRDYPTDPIEIECKKCSRYGRYQKATLIAGDCEFRGGLGNRGRGAIYPALSCVQKRKPPLEFG